MSSELAIIGTILALLQLANLTYTALLGGIWRSLREDMRDIRDNMVTRDACKARHGMHQ